MKSGLMARISKVPQLQQLVLKGWWGRCRKLLQEQEVLRLLFRKQLESSLRLVSAVEI